jgi:hypothetical protein
VPEDRIHIIYNGIDPDEYRLIETTDQLLKYGIDPEKPFVLFVGRIACKRGLFTWWTRLNTWSLTSRWCSARAPRTRARLRPK